VVLFPASLPTQNPNRILDRCRDGDSPDSTPNQRCRLATPTHSHVSLCHPSGLHEFKNQYRSAARIVDVPTLCNFRRLCHRKTTRILKAISSSGRASAIASHGLDDCRNMAQPGQPPGVFQSVRRCPSRETFWRFRFRLGSRPLPSQRQAQATSCGTAGLGLLRANPTRQSWLAAIYPSISQIPPPESGYVAVSVRYLTHEFAKDGSYGWLVDRTLTEIAGKSIYLYNLDR